MHFVVACSKGTYVRTLAHDLGTQLGSTAHLTALRREAIGDARVSDAWGVSALTDALHAAIRCACGDARRDPIGGSVEKAGEKGLRVGSRP